MFSLILGLTAFVLYFLYDINSITRQNRLVHAFFGVGTALLGVSAVLDLTAEKEGWQTLVLRGVQVFACQTTLADLEDLIYEAQYQSTSDR